MLFFFFMSVNRKTRRQVVGRLLSRYPRGRYQTEFFLEGRGSRRSLELCGVELCLTSLPVRNGNRLLVGQCSFSCGPEVPICEAVDAYFYLVVKAHVVPAPNLQYADVKWTYLPILNVTFPTLNATTTFRPTI